MSQLININDAVEGMVLAEPIFNKIGQVMIAKDINITSKQINILKMWGIKEIRIKRLEEDILVDNSSKIQQIKLQILNDLGWSNINDYIDEMIELAALTKIRLR